jgi:hypothetical protein
VPAFLQDNFILAAVVAACTLFILVYWCAVESKGEQGACKNCFGRYDWPLFNILVTVGKPTGAAGCHC